MPRKPQPRQRKSFRVHFTFRGYAYVDVEAFNIKDARRVAEKQQLQGLTKLDVISNIKVDVIEPINTPEGVDV